MRPPVSIVMPVLDAEPFANEAIDSVLSQTFPNFELIVVRNSAYGENDELPSSYRDSRIRIVNQEGFGIAAALNAGISHSRGRFITFIMASDRWLPEKLELHVIHLTANRHVGVSFAGSRFIDAAGNGLRLIQRPKLRDINAADIFCRNPIGNFSAAMVRRGDLDRVAAPHPVDFTRLCYFDETLEYSSDIEMWLRLALVGESYFEGIPGTLTDFRVVKGGLAAEVLRQYQSWQAMVERLVEFFPDFVAQNGDRAKAYQLRYLARRLVQIGDPGMAFALMKEAIATSKRPFVEEPIKSLTTYVAAYLGTKLSPDAFSRIMRASSGGQLVA